MINHICPRCQEPLSSPQDMGGRVEGCPSCNNACVVPSPAADTSTAMPWALWTLAAFLIVGGILATLLGSLVEGLGSIGAGLVVMALGSTLKEVRDLRATLDADRRRVFPYPTEKPPADAAKRP